MHSLPSKSQHPEKGQKASFSGRWTKEEHLKFIHALQIYGKNWKLVEEYIQTRSCAQIRSHAQKFFNRLDREMTSKQGKGLLCDEKIGRNGKDSRMSDQNRRRSGSYSTTISSTSPEVRLQEDPKIHWLEESIKGCLTEEEKEANTEISKELSPIEEIQEDHNIEGPMENELGARELRAERKMSEDSFFKYILPPPLKRKKRPSSERERGPSASSPQRGTMTLSGSGKRIKSQRSQLMMLFARK